MKFGQLRHDKLACSPNISQQDGLSKAFNTLTDTILEEIDFLSGTVRGELWRLSEMGFWKDSLWAGDGS